MRHQLAAVHELMRIGLLATLPGETLTRLAARTERIDLAPGETVGGDGRVVFVISGLLHGGAPARPGDVLDGEARAITPAVVGACDADAWRELAGG